MLGMLNARDRLRRILPSESSTIHIRAMSIEGGPVSPMVFKQLAPPSESSRGDIDALNEAVESKPSKLARLL